MRPVLAGAELPRQARRSRPPRQERPPLLARHLIGGMWTPSSSGATFADLDPWDGTVVASVAAGGLDETRAAVDAAQAAFPDWSAAPPAERQGVLLRAADIMAGRRAEVLGLLARETGAGAYFAGLQVDFAVAMLRQTAALPYASYAELMPSDAAGTRSMALRRPVGVVGAIAPWNAPLILSGRAVVAPLALGNTVVLKPSEESPVTGGVIWGEVLQQAGLPAGALNVVTHAPGEAGVIGGELIANPAVRRLSFTGSTSIGRRLAEAAGTHLKRLVLQVSGHNPLLVLAGVDLDYAVEAAAYGAFVHQGEVCMCVRRIIVERSISAAFVQALVRKVSTLPVGDPSDPATVIGPLINEWAVALIARRVDEAVALGARVLVGGTAAPPCYPATVLTNVPPEAELAFDETFGPVVIVDVVDDARHAVALANASCFGLAAGVLAGTLEHGLEIALQLRAGIVHVNDQPVNDEPQMPFGGMKDSGWGRFGVASAIEEFCELQWVSARSGRRTFPF